MRRVDITRLAKGTEKIGALPLTHPTWEARRKGRSLDTNRSTAIVLCQTWDRIVLQMWHQSIVLFNINNGAMVHWYYAAHSLDTPSLNCGRALGADRSTALARLLDAADRSTALAHRTRSTPSLDRGRARSLDTDRSTAIVLCVCHCLRSSTCDQRLTDCTEIYHHCRSVTDFWALCRTHSLTILTCSTTAQDETHRHIKWPGARAGERSFAAE